MKRINLSLFLAEILSLGIVSVGNAAVFNNNGTTPTTNISNSPPSGAQPITIWGGPLSGLGGSGQGGGGNSGGGGGNNGSGNNGSGNNGSGNNGSGNNGSGNRGWGWWK